MKDELKKWRLFAIVSVVSLIADQATKIWARASLPTDVVPCTPQDMLVAKCRGVDTPVISGLWDWRLSVNPGSAFGLFSNLTLARWILSIVGVAATVGMFMMLRKSRSDQKILHWAIGLVASGAVGNLIDRVRFGGVTDFISWHYHEHPWPTFNVADVVLVIGVGLMFIDMQKENKREKGAKKAAKAEQQKKAKEMGLIKDLRE
jgi:signal peptidase II